MSFLAHLFINQRKIRVLRSRVRFSQNKDMTGKPQGRVNGGVIYLTIELTRDTDLLHQMMHAEQMVEGYIRYYKRDGMSKLYDYEFFDTYVFYYRVHQMANGGNPAQVELGFSCGILRIGSAILKKPWHVTDLEAMEVEPTPAPEQESKVLEYYISNSENKKITVGKVGEQIYLNIRSRNYVGKKVSVSLRNPNVDFFYNGNRLINDILEDYYIESDHDRLLLDVVAQKTSE